MKIMSQLDALITQGSASKEQLEHLRDNLNAVLDDPAGYWVRTVGEDNFIVHDYFIWVDHHPGYEPPEHGSLVAELTEDGDENWLAGLTYDVVPLIMSRRSAV